MKQLPLTLALHLAGEPALYVTVAGGGPVLAFALRRALTRRRGQRSGSRLAWTLLRRVLAGIDKYGAAPAWIETRPVTEYPQLAIDISNREIVPATTADSVGNVVSFHDFARLPNRDLLAILSPPTE